MKTINPNIRAPLLIVLILFLGASFSVSSQVPKAESRTSDTRITTGASLPDLVPVGPASEPRADASLDSANYVIRLGDSLELKVYDEDDVNTETRVDQEGGITVPLLGRVVVQGLTTEAARQLITTRLHAEYILNPRVTLTVKEFAPRRFSVMGEVSRPGFFEIPARQKINLLQAIAMAGGYTRLADPASIRIRRITAHGEEILKFNAKKLASETAAEIPVILNEDNISVGATIF